MRSLIAGSLLAATAAGAQQTPAVRLINAPDAASKPILGQPAAVRELSGGQLLVNDVAKRQLVLLDRTLAAPVVVADSVSGGASSYGPRPGGLVGYLGDSTLFIDPADLSMFVIDPAGKIARVAAVPRSQDAPLMSNNLLSTPAMDTHGRLVYRGSPPRIMPKIGPKGEFSMPEAPDSAPIVRVDLATRKLDTAAFFKITRNRLTSTQNERGGMMITSEINPMQTLDDWAVLADGSIAIVRGRDYHIDWVNPDGGISSTPKIAYDWQRLTDEDKIAVIDSARAAMEKMRAAMPVGGSSQTITGAGAGGGAPTMVFQMSVSGVSSGGAPAAAPAAGGAAATVGLGGALNFVSASELPDYRPVFTAGGVKADLEGNVWVRTSAVRAGAIAGPIYDVINRQGAVVERMQVPSGRSIIGFGKGGVVYMLARDGAGAWIERTHR